MIGVPIVLLPSSNEWVLNVIFFFNLESIKTLNKTYTTHIFKSCTTNNRYTLVVKYNLNSFEQRFFY